MWWVANTAELKRPGQQSQAGRNVSTGDWSAELLQLAAQQRMNTDVRRTVFCVVMGSEDYMDASEKLLRLPLKVLPSYSKSTLLQAFTNVFMPQTHDNALDLQDKFDKARPSILGIR